MNVLKRLLLLAAVSVGLTACGGGGGDAGTPVLGADPGSGGATSVTSLLMTAPATQMPNTTSSSTAVTITALNSARNTVPNAEISVSADQDAVVTVSSDKTDASGKVVATVSLGSNRSTRVITVKATSGSVEQTLQLQVFGAKVTSVLDPAVVAPSGPGKVQYRVLDQVGNPMVGQEITVSAPGATPDSATGTTGANGEFTYSYTAPATAGSLKVSAMSGGAGDETTVSVQQASTVPNVSMAILGASVSANPSVVPVNAAGSQSNRTEIRALFVGTDNKPISNVRVRFDLNGDANSIGGTFTTNQTLYSDANGAVTTAYVPGARSSPTNGVTVRACYGISDNDPALINCTTFATTTLTVTNEPLGVSIGTNEFVVDKPLTYVKQFVVTVVDAAGVAKPDVTLSVSVDLPRFYKGFWFPGAIRWEQAVTDVCLNEDVNRNGVLETEDLNGNDQLDPGEDANGNGVLDVEDGDKDQRLEPGKSDVSVTLLNSKTGADGTALLEIQYAKSFGSWLDAWITVSASVSGSEGRATYRLTPIPVPSEALTSQTRAPAFDVSPYGTNAGCLNPN
jgi:hypothetical protein